MPLNQMIWEASKAWHGVKLDQPDWAESSHSVAFEAHIRADDLHVHLILNAYWEALDFELPALAGGGARSWRRWIDTALESQSRLLSPREAARLMGLPEEYVLPNNYNEAYHPCRRRRCGPGRQLSRDAHFRTDPCLCARRAKGGVMPADLQDALITFTSERKFNRKGPLCVALVMTQQARVKGLPRDPGELLTEGGGQVLGRGKSAVQSILQRHGITRVLASEGGRTSRGSIGNMREYVAFLNQLHFEGAADLDAIEGFWIARVHEFFAAKPLRIRLDASRSLRTIVRDVLDQAEERQKTTPGVYYAGAVMQHRRSTRYRCSQTSTFSFSWLETSRSSTTIPWLARRGWSRLSLIVAEARIVSPMKTGLMNLKRS